MEVGPTVGLTWVGEIVDVGKISTATEVAEIVGTSVTVALLVSAGEGAAQATKIGMKMNQK